MSGQAPAFVDGKAPSVGFVARLGFLFLLLYLPLYGLPFPVGEIPAQEDAWVAADSELGVESGIEVGRYANKWLTEVTDEVHDLVAWSADLAGYEGVEHAETGSGDGPYDQARVALLLILAALGAVVLALFPIGRRTIGFLHGLLRIYVRFGLASAMCVYGFYKVLPLQFPALAGDRLLGTYGDASPMNMLWSFMGASEPYTVLVGLAEVLGGVLLLVRRTTTLGAMVTLGVMTHVLLLNLCYDVPVKLFSLHMVIYAAFLLGGDAPRLWAMFFSHRAMPARRLRMNVPIWLLVPWVSLGLAAAAAVVGVPLQRAWSAWEQRQEQTTGPLAGLWEVLEYERLENGQNRPSAEHWRTFVVSYWPGQGGAPASVAVVSRNSGRKFGGFATIDADARTVSIARPPGPPLLLDYEEQNQPGEGEGQPARRLVLSGDDAGSQLSVVLEHRDESTFRINRTKFRWVQERPENRNGR